MPEHAVVMTIVTWIDNFCGANVKPGAVEPEMAWTLLLTPRRLSTALVLPLLAMPSIRTGPRRRLATGPRATVCPSPSGGLEGGLPLRTCLGGPRGQVWSDAAWRFEAIAQGPSRFCTASQSI